MSHGQVRECDLTNQRVNLINVSYESLVLDPKTQMTRVMKFLGYNFDSAMLNHSSQINNITLAPNGNVFKNWTSDILNLSSEPSTSQVSKPIYKSAIYDWVDRLAQDKSAKTRRALEKLETMPTWARIKRYFPRYDRKPSVEKQKLEAQLKKENDKERSDWLNCSLPSLSLEFRSVWIFKKMFQKSCPQSSQDSST